MSRSIRLLCRSLEVELGADPAHALVTTPPPPDNHSRRKSRTLNTAAILAALIHLALAATLLGIPGSSTTLDSLDLPHDNTVTAPPVAMARDRLKATPTIGAAPVANTTLPHTPRTVQPTIKPTTPKTSRRTHAPSPTRTPQPAHTSPPTYTQPAKADSQQPAKTPAATPRHTQSPAAPETVPQPSTKNTPPGQTRERSGKTPPGQAKEPHGQAAEKTHEPKREPPATDPDHPSQQNGNPNAGKHANASEPTQSSDVGS